MTTPTETPVTNAAPAPAAPASSTTTAPNADVARLDGENKRLSEALAQANERTKNLTTSVTTLTAERDGFAAQIADLTPKAKKATELEATVTTLTNEKRERSFIEGLRKSGKFPGADDVTIAGAVTKLHEAGKFNRFAEDSAAEVTKAVPILIEQAPTLTHPPPNVSGGSPRRRPGPGAPGGNPRWYFSCSRRIDTALCGGPWVLHAVLRKGIKQTGVREAHIRRRASRGP